MENINCKRNKCIGKKKQFLKLIKPLGSYTFECALIYLQSLIRNSILYAPETIYKVNKIQYKAFQKIEEPVLKNSVKDFMKLPQTLNVPGHMTSTCKVQNKQAGTELFTLHLESNK